MALLMITTYAYEDIRKFIPELSIKYSVLRESSDICIYAQEIGLAVIRNAFSLHFLSCI